MNKNTKLLFDKFAERPVAYYPVYARICGSVTAGLLLSQLVYWDSKTSGNEFYKTDLELREEIYLSRHEFMAAKKNIQLKGFVSIQLKNWPAKTFYKVEVDQIVKEIELAENRTTESPKTGQLDVRKPDNRMSENRTTIYKTTTENTTYRIFEVWNTLNIIRHREFEKFESLIQAKLKNYSEEEIIQAIKNLKFILDSPDHYYSHKWTLDKFLTRKGVFDQFLDLDGAMVSFANKSNGNGYRSQAEINSASNGQVVI
jgi:hypothetical protein